MTFIWLNIVTASVNQSEWSRPSSSWYSKCGLRKSVSKSMSTLESAAMTVDLWNDFASAESHLPPRLDQS